MSTQLRLKITAENIAVLQEALDAFQGRRTKNIYGAEDVIYAAQQTETQLENLDLPKSKRQGARCQFAGEGASANAYKYAITSTQVTIERGSKDWYLVGLTIVSRYPKNPPIDTLFLTEAQAEEVVKQVRKQFTVLRPAVAA
jgi:hypothetical protein